MVGELVTSETETVNVNWVSRAESNPYEASDLESIRLLRFGGWFHNETR